MHEYAHAQFCSYGDDELMHYGRKGMKWGQNIFAKVRANSIRRKKVKNLEKARAAKVQKQKEAADRQKLLDKGAVPVKKMTTEEIQQKIARMELEKNYNKLKLETSKVAKGKKFAMDILEQSGKNIGIQLTTYALGAGVNKIAKDLGYKNSTRTYKDEDGKEFTERIFEDIVNPRKGQKDK